MEAQLACWMHVGLPSRTSSLSTPPVEMPRPFFLLVVCTLFLSMLSLPATAVERQKESIGAVEPETKPEIYGQGVRETDWLSPEDELAGFHLPPGFEARLFASEPQIAKPLNLAFDSSGRLWMTQSVEYPYPAKAGTTPRDAVMVLEDVDGDGSADTVTTFADELNIPIGILPYGDGCICFSIPNLLYLRDTDGDGRCDRREVILGPFDTTRDTHGMINALRDGGDGWIYACHGFNNQSQVAGRDGHTVTMHSGNTFRFRVDGSRVEHVTFGQVNPFGMTEDDWGYRYSADCHSKPITQLIFGACYPSFGRPHDGLGFLPPMVDHLHGSTAICGIQYFSDDSPVVPLRGQMISGNVMTSRLNRNRVVYEGATANGIELSDFMTSEDPWFRPVDLRLGPDGHLYVADFYNKIIGHYEVPLDHPDRDRESGRIWQIRYRDPEPDRGPGPSSTEGTTAHSPSDRDKIESLRRRAGEEPMDVQSIEERLTDSSDRVRVAAMRLAKEAVRRKLPGSAMLTNAARRGLQDRQPHFVQASAELLGRHGSTQDVGNLLQQLGKISEKDPVLRQTFRIAIRNLLGNAPAEAEIWSAAANEDLASILLGLKRPEVAPVLLDYLSSHPNTADRDALLAQAAVHSAPGSIDQCVTVARRITGTDRAKQQQVIEVLLDSTNVHGDAVADSLRRWGIDLVDQKLRAVRDADRVIGWSTDDGAAWPIEARKLRSGEDANLVSSFGRGETYTGSRLSDPFPAPETISFWIAGHNGFPDQPDHGKNSVQLLRASNGEVLAKATPPRNDRARRVKWNTESLGGDLVRIECVDGDNAGAYAWLAIGRFDPPWLDASDQAQTLADALRLIRRLRLTQKESELIDLLREGPLALSLRQQVAQTVASLRGRRVAELVLRASQVSAAPIELVEMAIDASFSDDPESLLEPTEILCKRLSHGQQIQFATEWAKSGADTDLMLRIIQSGWLSPSVLANGDVAQAIAPRLSAEQQELVRSLTAELNVDAKQTELLRTLQANITGDGADLARGESLFAKHCATCHQLRGKGLVVGPQLDGAASRSVQRLLEDIITPDRNVDHAFRTTSFLLDDGRVVSGLVTSESDTEIVVVEPTGKPITLDPNMIEQRREAGRSLMPGNMGEVLTVEELRDLIHFVKGG